MNTRTVARKQLGLTGIDIPEIGFGTWRYSGGVRPLRTAIEQGAAFIDTAETYGSEEVVGQAIRDCRQQVFLATKVRPLNFRKSDVALALEGSLRRLGTDYVDLYQLHWPNYIVPIEETMSALESLVNAGKVRFIGVSNFSAKELAKAQRALGKARIVANQVKYSLIERTVEDRLIEYCEKNNITVIAFSPFGETYSVLREFDPEGTLRKIAAKYQKSEAQVALNWLLAKPPVVVIPRASTPEHVIDDCGASSWSMDPSDYDLLAQKVRFKRRSPLERLVRRTVRRVVQHFGKSL